MGLPDPYPGKPAGDVLRNLLTRRDDAKEVRLFTLARHLLDRWLGLLKASPWSGGSSSQAGLARRPDQHRSTAAYSGCLLIVASLIAGPP